MPLVRSAFAVVAVLALGCAPAPREPPAPTREPVAAEATIDLPDAPTSAPVSATLDANASVEVLVAARDFGAVAVGYFASVPDDVVAFRVVLADAHAADHFRDVFRRATPAGKLYALAGLHWAAPEDVPGAQAALRKSHAEVVFVQDGCWGDPQTVPVARLANDFARWPARLAGRDE